MSEYRVAKILNRTSESIELTYFENEETADEYAQKQSLNDEDHFYAVEKEVEEDDYEDISHFIGGKRGAFL